MKMKNRVLLLIMVIAAVCVFSACEIAKPPAAEIKMRAERERIISLLEKDVEKIAPIKPFLRLLPEEVEIVCRLEYTGDENACIRVSEVLVNGSRIPDEILRNISENYLDFSCSLVYN